MKTNMGAGSIAPVRSAAFSPRSYNPKAKKYLAKTKITAKQSSFSKVLSALITTDNAHLPQKTVKSPK
ncbi:MAG TPA: hypothetical protein VN426_11755 [Syntrophomonadaceae bacterium]|nr:hypothetical protein [Syntrophomonadaceae bacterium]